MLEELTKGQYKEVESLFSKHIGELKSIIEGSERRSAEQISGIFNRLRKVEKGLLTLQVKNGILATIMGAIASFITAIGFHIFGK